MPYQEIYSCGAVTYCRPSGHCSTGPTGPTGPAAPSVFGGLYNAASTTLPIPATTQTILSNLDSAMPSDGVQPNLGTASLTIERSGTYLINFAVSYLYSNNAFVEIFVTANGTRIPGTVASRDAQTAERVKNVAQSALARLTAGTVLQLAAYASTGGNLWLQNDGTVLNAVRVGD